MNKRGRGLTSHCTLCFRRSMEELCRCVVLRPGAHTAARPCSRNLSKPYLRHKVTKVTAGEIGISEK